MASCVLHNFLREKSPLLYTPPGSFDTENNETGEIKDGEWRTDGTYGRMKPINVSGRNRYANSAKEVRENFCTYFNSDIGSVSWQDNFV